jgi:membrane protease YdiL (CAAX protease family)
MSSITADAPTPLPPFSSPPAPLPKRGYPLIAWLIIVLAAVYSAAYVPIHSFISKDFEARFKDYNERNYLSDLQVQGRMLVGQVRVMDQPPEVVEPQIQEGLTHGPYEQRLRFVILTGELKGPEAALQRLSEMRSTDWEQQRPTEREAKLTELVEKVYRVRQRQLLALLTGSIGGGVATVGQDSPLEHLVGSVGGGVASIAAEDAEKISDTDRAQLHNQFGWFGDLALAPEGGSNVEQRAAVLAPARRIIWVFVGIVVTFLMLASLGFLLLFVFGLAIFLGLTRFRFQTGSRDGGLYAETFALWMVLYLVLERVAGYVPLGSFRMLAAGVVGLASLGTLAWPVLRGVTWPRVRQDLGWWTPRSAPVEVLWGLGSYMASFPLLASAVLISSTMLNVYTRLFPTEPFGIPPQSTHPVKEMLEQGNWWDYLQIFFVASICAPIIEETMFRGVLYRHLREIGEKWPRILSVLFSIVSASFVFAVIHPQGFLGVPMLMALATGFALTRELRGSLLGSIAAHGVHNAIVTVVAISMS